MIFCNNCGNPLDARGVCPTCQVQASHDSRGTPPPTERFPSPTAAAAGRAAAPTVPYQQPNYGNAQAPSPTAPYQQPNYGNAQPAWDNNLPFQPQPTVKPRSNAPVALIVIGGIVLIIGVALVIFVAVTLNNRSAPTTVTSTPPGSSGTSTAPANTGPSADDVAASLDNAIDSGRLVNLTGDDAYSSFLQLRAIDPKHPALSNVKSKVLQKLRDQGEEIINRKVNHSGEVSLQDWQISVRRYEWVHVLEPGDQKLEARQKYFLGKLAEAQDRRTEAWQNFTTAAKLDSSWAVPQNDLGYWISQSPGAGDQKWSNAVPYYERAISLQPNWEIPYNNLGTAYFYLKNYDQAESYYGQAIQRNSNWARPHKWLGDIHIARNNLGQAAQEYRTTVKLYNPNTDSLKIDAIRAEVARLERLGY